MAEPPRSWERIETAHWPTARGAQAMVAGGYELATRAALGHRVEPWDDFSWRGGGVCLVRLDAQRGIVEGAADPRRERTAARY